MVLSLMVSRRVYDMAAQNHTAWSEVEALPRTNGKLSAEDQARYNAVAYGGTNALHLQFAADNGLSWSRQATDLWAPCDALRDGWEFNRRAVKFCRPFTLRQLRGQKGSADHQGWPNDSVWDHVEKFKREREPAACLTHPYVWGDADRINASLARSSAELGLAFHVLRGASWYNPGSTLTILVVAPGTEVRFEDAGVSDAFSTAGVTAGHIDAVV